MSTNLQAKIKQAQQKAKDDPVHFMATALQIRAKKPVMIDGVLSKIVPFKLNRAQQFLHAQLEKQLQEQGKVRALLLKGRQQGCSTYVGARFYHKTIFNRGMKTFILAHLGDATANLFKMVQRFHEHCNPLLKQHTSFSNRQELVFDKIDSAYALGTAGTKTTGRSDTIDFLHGSESAFWENTDDIKTGVFQAAEMAREIILETTANGLGNMFHRMWQDAEAGKGEYIAIFIPWFWQPEYSSTPPADFQITKEEQAYKTVYDLQDHQIYWRRNKIIELGNPLLFKQEYPGNASEAFQTTGINSLISPESVLISRKTMNVQKYGAYIIGCDPAREGDDSTTFIRRQGRHVWGLEIHNKLDDMAKAGLARKILETEKVDRMLIDRGGGSGMHDRLVEMGFGKRVSLVNFGGKAHDPDKYKNRRAEMWDALREWLESDLATQIPDMDLLQADLTSVSYKYTSTTQLQLEPKSDIKKRIGKSPDVGDALALTFAEPVRIRKTRTRRKYSGMAV